MNQTCRLRDFLRYPTNQPAARTIGLFAVIAGLSVAEAQPAPDDGAKKASQEQPMLGFGTDNAAQEHALEKQFDSQLKRENLDAWMKRMSARPHHVGSAFDKENAEFIAAQFRDWGYETEIEVFDVLFLTSNTRSL